MRVRFLVAILFLLAVSPEVPRGSVDRSVVESCLARPRAGEKVECIESARAGRPVGPSDLRMLERLIDIDPGAAEALATVWESAGPPTVPSSTPSQRSLAAETLDLHAQALSRLGRHSDAAARYRRAIEIDDGTRALVWLRENGSPVWRASLDPGNGRLVRAALALTHVEDEHQARDLLARAIAVGARGGVALAWEGMGGGPVPGIDPRPTELLASPWFPHLPDVKIPYLDGGHLRLSEQRGKVVVLDFWASWCAPCLEELPHLQRLFERERERGLVTIAVNAQETKKTARTTARGLGLTVPLGMYDSAVDEAFRVRRLPTLVVADRRGRIRARWDGYVNGLEARVAEQVEDLLGEDTAGMPRPIATVVTGAGRLAVRWARELGRSAAGLAVVDPSGTSPRVAAVANGELVVLGRDGSTLGRMEVPSAMGRVVVGDVDGDGRAELIGYRPGDATVVVLEADSGSHRAWEAPAAMMDVALVRRPGVVDGDDSSSSGMLLGLGTLEGVHVATSTGEILHRAVAPGRITGLTVARKDGAERIVAIDSDGAVRWHDAGGRLLSRAAGPAKGWKLVANPAEEGTVGVLPLETTAAVAGSFLASGAHQVAVAMASGQLLLVDLGSGETVYRARWEGIRELAAGDLDGDGRDELVVAFDRSVAVLEGAAGQNGEATP